MSYGTELAELSAQIDTARAALAAAERLARQLQERAEAERAQAEAEAQRTDLSGERTGSRQLEQAVPPVEVEPIETVVKRSRGRPVGSRDSYKRPPRSKQPEVAAQWFA